MKLLQKTLLALAAGSLMTAGAQAAVNYGNGMTAQPYIGAKIGMYDADDADDEATSYGVYGGAKFTPNWGAELEYMTTSDADVNEFSEYNGEVYGLYATYDYTFPSTAMYAKGRLGFAKNEIEIDPKNLSSYSESDSSIAGGVGLGYNLSPNAAVEVAYEWYPSVEFSDQDVDVSGITLGANFKF